MAEESIPVNFNSEEARKDSFKSYTSSQCKFTDKVKEDYARAGFYWSGNNEEVKCNFCHFKVPYLEQNEEDPIALHCRYNSTCPLLCRRATNNIPINGELLNTFLPPPPTFVAGYPRPKYPDYSTSESRMFSFRRWPSNNFVHKNDLVSAGFFYVGPGDIVCCYFCGLGLKNFTRGENPLETHKQMRSECQYIKHISDREPLSHTVKSFISRPFKLIYSRLVK